MAQHLLRVPARFTEEHARAFIDRAIEGLQQAHTYTLVMEVQSSAEAIGVITLRIPSRDPSYPETLSAEDQRLGILGYSLLPNMWGQGYASESARRVVAFAFNGLQLERIQASPLQTNSASKRILDRLGFAIVEANILEEPLHGGVPQLGDRYLLYRS